METPDRRNLITWLRYSGFCVIIQGNPLYWKLWPWLRREYHEWMGPQEKTWAATWLFLTIRIWIDDGSW